MSLPAAVFAAAALLAAPTADPEKGPGPEAAFDALAAQAIDKRAEAFKGAAKAFKEWPGRGRTTIQAGAQEQAIHAPSLGLPDATTVTKRAQAAINTSVKGAQAGVAVAFLGLMGVPAPGDLQLSLAALDQGATRFGATASYNLGPEVDGTIPLAELHIPACKFDKQAEVKDLTSIRDAFITLCSEVIQKLPPGPFADESRGHCGLTRASGESRGIQSAIADIERAIDEENKDKVPLTVYQRGKLQALVAFREPRPDECLTDEELKQALVSYDWRHMTHQFGLGGTATLLPFHLGFQPDTPLSQGEWIAANALVSYTFHYQYYEVAGTLGWNRSRDDLSSPLLSSVTWSLSPSVAVWSFSSTPLWTDQGPCLVDGRLPPRLVFGIDIAGKVATSGPPEKQGLISVDLGMHFDFRFTDDLAVRLGVPLHGERLARESDGMSGLNWTLPVSITTVLSL